MPIDYKTRGKINQYSKTCVKPVWNGHSKIVKTKILMTNGSLMRVESIAECSPWSILQYFWSALSDNWSWKFYRSLWERQFYTGFTVSVNKPYILT